MHYNTIVGTLAIAAIPAFAHAQSTRAVPETVYVRGTVTGEVPPPGADLRYVKGTIVALTPAPTTLIAVDTATTMMTTMPSETPPKKPSLDKKVKHGVGEAAGDASKLGKKAVHGVKEAASDVKKKVTGKP